VAFSDDVDSSHFVIESSGLGHVDSLHVAIKNKCVSFHKIYRYWACLHSSNFELNIEFRVSKITIFRQFSQCSRKNATSIETNNRNEAI
jgi:hypothetical protein